MAGAGLDYVQLGIQTGLMAAKVLTGEAACEDLPYETIENYGLYIMGTDGKAVLVCRVKEKGSVYVREYLEQIHLSAPWMAIGYSAENRQAFGAYEKSETIAKIIAKKDKMMSQFPF